MAFSRLDLYEYRKISDWLYDEDGKCIPEKAEIFARAWMDGYDIEKEALYTVEIPDPHGLYKIRFLYRGSDGNIRIGGNDCRDVFLSVETHLTEAEIKKDFAWAFQFAKPVEEN